MRPTKDLADSKALARLPDSAWRRLASHLQVADKAEAAAVLAAIMQEVRPSGVVDLWEPREAALTYWVLMLTGVNQPDEMRLASDLLAWQAFFSKDSARVLCIQSSERDAFRCCSLTFDINECPTLVMSDTPDMKSYVKLSSPLLTALASSSGELQRFLTRLHALTENGRDLSQLQELMAAEAFWRGLKIVYKEMRSLISIKLSPP